MRKVIKVIPITLHKLACVPVHWSPNRIKRVKLRKQALPNLYQKKIYKKDQKVL